MDSVEKAVETYFATRTEAWITKDYRLVEGWLQASRHGSAAYMVLTRALRAKHAALERHGQRLARVHTKIFVMDSHSVKSGKHGMAEVFLSLEEHIRFVLDNTSNLTVECRVIVHHHRWRKIDEEWKLVAFEESGERVAPTYVRRQVPAARELVASGKSPKAYPAHRYDRRLAVRYADLWWNRQNRTYPYFTDDDCTNYISQCLHAGRLMMTGGSDPARGWWVVRQPLTTSSASGELCSYSWSVSNALYVYLLQNGIGTELAQPSELLMGDLVFYDWNGSGTFHHTTIITEFDSLGNPLVNAHSDASLRRPYAYLDSRAFTTNTRYRFIHVRDGQASPS